MGKLESYLIRKCASRVSAEDFLNVKEKLNLESSLSSQFHFLAAMPKSAGTYATKVLADYFDTNACHISDRSGGCEFDIYRPRLIDQFKKGAIVHQHTLGTEGNVEYLKKYQIKTVVLIRNIFDVMVSFRDHLLSESMRWPFLSFDGKFEELSKREQYDFLIKFAFPWLIHFYVSWYKATKAQKQISAYWCCYESMLKDKEVFFEEVIAWYSNSDVNQNKLERILQTNYGKSRFNIGVAGRGLEELDGDQIEEMRLAVSGFSEIDFLPLGLWS